MGFGGHGAFPHQTKDVIMAGSALVEQIQSIVSRNMNPCEMGVITIGSFKSESNKGNVIGDKCKLKGTMRWFKDENEKLLKERLHEVCRGIEIIHKVDVKLEFEEYEYASTINHESGYKVVCDAARVIIGDDGLEDNMESIPGGEDFSYFLRKKPGAFFFLGGKPENEISYHHQSVFKIDQRCIIIGVNVFTQIVKNLLMTKSSKL